MNSVFTLTASTAILFTTSALADGYTMRPVPNPTYVESAQDNLDVIGYLEYNFEAENMESGVGVEYTYESLTVTPMFIFTDHDVERAEVTFDYGISDTTNVYFRLESNEDFEFEEATVGIGFRF